MENKKRKVIEIDNEIYNRFVYELRRRGKSIGETLNELMKGFIDESVKIANKTR